MYGFVKDLDPWQDGQVLALYKDEEGYVVVSTVNLDKSVTDPASKALVGVVGVIAGYATSGEETMVFRCDASGEPESWAEVFVANGDNSRARVLEQMGVS